jgi:hypothetical protein
MEAHLSSREQLIEADTEFEAAADLEMNPN